MSSVIMGIAHWMIDATVQLKHEVVSIWALLLFASDYLSITEVFGLVR